MLNLALVVGSDINRYSIKISVLRIDSEIIAVK